MRRKKNKLGLNEEKVGSEASDRTGGQTAGKGWKGCKRGKEQEK